AEETQARWSPRQAAKSRRLAPRQNRWRSVEPKDLLERQRPGVGNALLQQARHRVLPPGADLLLGQKRGRPPRIVGLEVAEDLIPVAENRVVADPRIGQGDRKST